MKAGLLAGRQPGPSGPLIEDSFDRADAAIGDAETGQTWAISGTGSSGWATLSNEAYQSSNIPGGSGNYLAAISIDAGQVDVDITVDVTAAQTGGGPVNAGIIFRYVSGAANFWRFVLARNSSGTLSWYLQKSVSSTVTNAASGTPSGLTGTLRVTDDGTDIECFIDGASVATTSDTALNTATRQGLTVGYNRPTGAGSGTGWRFNDFLVVAL